MARATALTVLAVLACGGAAGAQSPTITTAPLTKEQKNWRYQVGVMERVLEEAVEHGADLTRERLQLDAAIPSQMLVTETARARGFQLAGYGIFFDVEVPPLDGTIEGSLLWTMRTLDQNDLGLQSALNALKQYVSSVNDPGLQQAMRRVELQYAPATSIAPADDPAGTEPRLATGSAASVDATPAGSAAADAAAADAVPDDPIAAYHHEVMNAIMDVMLEHGGALAVDQDQWLTVAVRRISSASGLSGNDDDNSRTFIARISGAGLRAFRSGSVSKEEALKRIEVRVF